MANLLQEKKVNGYAKDVLTKLGCCGHINNIRISDDCIACCPDLSRKICLYCGLLSAAEPVCSAFFVVRLLEFLISDVGHLGR